MANDMCVPEISTITHSLSTFRCIILFIDHVCARALLDQGYCVSLELKPETVVSSLTWLLGTKSRSSEGAASALNH